MNVWYHLPTILGMRFFLRVASLLALCVALITMLLFAAPSYAAPSENQVIGFQGRLMNANGDVVPDGFYNIQFNVYQGGNGLQAGNPGGTLVWTETYINAGKPKGAVEVKNGLLSVNLGSITPFDSNIDWSQGALWLSMNIAGSATNCTAFGTGSCDDDGEMLPMKRMTAAPFAMNAGAIGGKTINNLLQLSQGVQTDATANTSSIFINKTGTGNILQLQASNRDVFTLNNSGDILLGNNGNKVLSVTSSLDNASGNSLSILAGNGGDGSGSAGGDLILQSGGAGGLLGNSGNIQIDTGAPAGQGIGGEISIGVTNASSVTIGSDKTATIGMTTIQAKNTVTISTNGLTRASFSDTENIVTFGDSNNPGDFTLQAANSSSDKIAGGSLNLQGGNATIGDTDGGNLILSGGDGSGSGARGLVILETPTFSTVINDVNCYTDGTTVLSSCTIASSTVNSSAAVVVGFSMEDQVATLPDPSLTTAGRIIYLMAAKDSEAFTLRVNEGGTGNEFTMQPNTATAMIWNGDDWLPTVASPSNSQTDTPLTVPDGSEEPLLGSIYYDTALGMIQCYEESGWGSCDTRPDNFVSLSPEYSNTVMNGSDLGDITSGICSDTLNINDGSDTQPVICDTNETQNFYNWTSPDATTQTKELYVTYQLPATFTEFVEGSTSLTGRTDSADASVSYQIYRNSSTGLEECSAASSVASGATGWQTAVTADPSACTFNGGDSIVFRISMSSANNANAYVGNLNFVFSNN